MKLEFNKHLPGDSGCHGMMQKDDTIRLSRARQKAKVDIPERMPGLPKGR
jgi:hypothetical protein